MSFVGLTKDRYPHERICLFISTERSLLSAERVEDRWRTFLSTLWLRSVNNSLRCWCSAYPKTVHIKRICLLSGRFTHPVTPVCSDRARVLEPFASGPHALTSTFLLYRSPSPFRFSLHSSFNHFAPAWAPQTSHNAFLHLQACGVLWVQAAFGSSKLSSKEQTGEVGGVWVCVCSPAGVLIDGGVLSCQMELGRCKLIPCIRLH